MNEPTRTQTPASTSPNRLARYLWARLLSVAGAAATTVVVPVLVFQTTGSAAVTGAVAAIGGITYLALGIPVGFVADRWHRGRLLTMTLILRGVALAVIPIASVAGAMSLPLLVGVLVVTNALFVATDAANTGSLRTVVGVDALPKATSLVSGSAGVVEIVAPVVAGAALAFTTPEMVFTAEVLLLFAAAGLTWSMRRSLDRRASDERQLSLTWSAAMAGLAFVSRDGPTRTTTIAAFVFAFTEGMIIGQLIVILTARSDSATAPMLLGASYAGIAIGSIVGAALAAWIRLARAPARYAGFALLTAAVLLLAYLLVGSPVIDVIIIGVWAVPFMTVFVGAIAMRQARADEALQSRVAVAGRLLTLGIGVPAGSVIGGLITQATTIDVTFVSAAAVSAAAALVLLGSALRRSAARFRLAAQAPSISRPPE